MKIKLCNNFFNRKKKRRIEVSEVEKKWKFRESRKEILLFCFSFALSIFFFNISFFYPFDLNSIYQIHFLPCLAGKRTFTVFYFSPSFLFFRKKYINLHVNYCINSFYIFIVADVKLERKCNL